MVSWLLELKKFQTPRQKDGGQANKAPRQKNGGQANYNIQITNKFQSASGGPIFNFQNKKITTKARKDPG
jgi:hypothetical protein